jgi:hypothetical protein
MPVIVQPAFCIEVLPLKTQWLRHRFNERYRQIAVGAVRRTSGNLSFAIEQFLRGAQMVIQVVVNLRLISLTQ